MGFEAKRLRLCSIEDEYEDLLKCLIRRRMRFIVEFDTLTQRLTHKMDEEQKQLMVRMERCVRLMENCTARMEKMSSRMIALIEQKSNHPSFPSPKVDEDDKWCGHIMCTSTMIKFGEMEFGQRYDIVYNNDKDSLYTGPHSLRRTVIGKRVNNGISQVLFKEEMNGLVWVNENTCFAVKVGTANPCSRNT